MLPETFLQIYYSRIFRESNCKNYSITDLVFQEHTSQIQEHTSQIQDFFGISVQFQVL